MDTSKNKSFKLRIHLKENIPDKILQLLILFLPFYVGDPPVSGSRWNYLKPLLMEVRGPRKIQST